MAEEVKDKQKMLKKLEQDLEKLNIITRQFNIFKVLKSEEYEIRHSNFLAWLMRPNENHDLGDYFLKEFLKSATKNYFETDKINVKSNDIEGWNLSDAIINREDKNIDILIFSTQNNFVCVIENKINSGENGTQLSRYAKWIEKDFKEYKKLFIYLSKETNNNELIPRSINKDKTVYYIPMCYEQVKDVINNVLKFKSSDLNNEVKIFIEHYKKNIERYIMNNTDEETKKLCLDIYYNNKEAIDLIIENNEKLFPNFAKQFNKKLFETIKDEILKKHKKNNRNDTFQQYGTAKYHYEILKLDDKNIIRIAFHIEKQKTEEAINCFSEKFLQKLKKYGFKEVEAGIGYDKLLEKEFYKLTNDEINNLTDELIPKFVDLYKATSDYVKNELWQKTD